MQTFPRHPSSLRPRANARLAAAAALLALLAALVFACVQSARAATSSASPISEEALEERGQEALPERPSFVVIQTDDETLDQLYAIFDAGGVEIPTMPNTLSMIAGRGAT